MIGGLSIGGVSVPAGAPVAPAAAASAMTPADGVVPFGQLVAWLAEALPEPVVTATPAAGRRRGAIAGESIDGAIESAAADRPSSEAEPSAIVTAPASLPVSLPTWLPEPGPDVVVEAETAAPADVVAVTASGSVARVEPAPEAAATSFETPEARGVTGSPAPLVIAAAAAAVGLEPPAVSAPSEPPATGTSVAAATAGNQVPAATAGNQSAPPPTAAELRRARPLPAEFDPVVPAPSNGTTQPANGAPAPSPDSTEPVPPAVESTGTPSSTAQSSGDLTPRSDRYKTPMPPVRDVPTGPPSGRDRFEPNPPADAARAAATAPLVAAPAARAAASVASVLAQMTSSAAAFGAPPTPPAGRRWRGTGNADVPASPEASAAAGRVVLPVLLETPAPIAGRIRDGLAAGDVATPLRRGSDLAAPVVTPALAPEYGRDAARPPLAASVPPSGPAPLDDVLPTQIIRSIRLQWQAGQGEARVQLRPEYLGELTVAVKVDQGVVTATLHAEAPEVRRWLETHSASLRDALAEQGLKLDRLIVVDERGRQDAPSSDRRQPHGDEQGDAPSRRRRGQTPDGQPVFDLPTSDSHERTHA